MVPALLKWIGSKQRFAETIVGYMPQSFSNYYEPFLGSGAVLGELLRQSKERFFPSFEMAFAYDVLPFLIDVFSITKESPEILAEYYTNAIREYYLSPEREYEVIRNRFNLDHNALDFCLLSRTCYSGIIRFRKADGYMSTPRGPHKPLLPASFEERVQLWSALIQKVEFATLGFNESMKYPQKEDVVYCDPPYTHSQGILYGAQGFNIEDLWLRVEECKKRGAYVIVSLNCLRESKSKDISVSYPEGLFEREILIDCGSSMIDRLQNKGHSMENGKVHDKLLLTW